MHDYNTILGVIELRLSKVSYDSVQKRYRIGRSGIALIMNRYKDSGLSLDDLRQMPASKVVDLIYPKENLRHKDIPLPDFEKIHEQMIQMGKHADLSFLWIDYKKEHPNGYQLVDFKPYRNADRICALHMETGREDKSEFLMIPADEIGKITEAKIRKALECLKCEMFQKLKVMDKERIACIQNDRQPSFTYRKYAFVAQQYVNVSLVLENEFTFNNAMPSNTRINRTKYVNVSNDSKAAQKNENNLINNMGNYFNIKLSGWEDEK